MTPIFSIGDLPTGPRGRLLAASLAIFVAAVVGFGVIAPALSWYAERADTLKARQALAQRMATLAATFPELERQAAGMRADSAEPDALLTGATDAIAAASLQERMQALSSQAGVPLSSVEILPVAQVGQVRRIGLRVAAGAEMDKIVHLLASIEDARPRMLIGELDLQRQIEVAEPARINLQARFVVYAFRAGPPDVKAP